MIGEPPQGYYDTLDQVDDEVRSSLGMENFCAWQNNFPNLAKNSLAVKIGKEGSYEYGMDLFAQFS